MIANKPTHAPRDHWRSVDGCLQVNGVALTRLAARVGQTPFFAYDRQLLRERVANPSPHCDDLISTCGAIVADVAGGMNPRGQDEITNENVVGEAQQRSGVGQLAVDLQWVGEGRNDAVVGFRQVC